MQIFSKILEFQIPLIVQSLTSWQAVCVMVERLHQIRKLSHRRHILSCLVIVE